MKNPLLHNQPKKPAAWTTSDELNFLKGLDIEDLKLYKKNLWRRSVWGDINKQEVEKYLNAHTM